MWWYNGRIGLVIRMCRLGWKFCLCVVRIGWLMCQISGKWSRRARWWWLCDFHISSIVGVCMLGRRGITWVSCGFRIIFKILLGSCTFFRCGSCDSFSRRWQRWDDEIDHELEEIISKFIPHCPPWLYNLSEPFLWFDWANRCEKLTGIVIEDCMRSPYSFQKMLAFSGTTPGVQCISHRINGRPLSNGLLSWSH